MKKIPTLFKKVYENHRVVDILDEITPGCEEAFEKGVATIKRDGSCCAVIDGEFYKRYDCKNGKTPPKDAIACCDPDPVTGHWPHWVKVDPMNPSDKWFIAAYNHTLGPFLTTLKEIGYESALNGTYEALGPHFQGNPYRFDHDCLRRHGEETVYVRRSFDSIKKWLSDNEEEGLVFWLNGEPVCKIKRTDFGFEWPIKRK